MRLIFFGVLCCLGWCPFENGEQCGTKEEAEALAIKLSRAHRQIEFCITEYR